MSKNKKPKDTHTAKASSSPYMRRATDFLSQRPAAVTQTLTALATFAILLLFYGNYMCKTEGLSLFLPTATYFSQCMASPGGLLVWLSTCLTQFMIYPWLGALIYALLMAAVTAAGYKTFGTEGNWRYIAVVPTALILLAYINLGYLIFTIKPAGYAFNLPLGVLIALWLCRLCGKIGILWLRLAAIAVIVVGGYPLFGFYALFAGLLAALRPCGRRRDKIAPHSYRLKGRAAWLQIGKAAVPVIFAAVLIWLWPQWRFYNIDSNLILTQVYTNPLPRFYSHETGWKALYAAIFAIYTIAATLAGRKLPIIDKLGNAVPAKAVKHAPMAIGIAALVCVIAFRYSDRNFMTTLDLDRAIWEQDWPKAAEIAKNLDNDPTRINTVLAYIALMRNGEAAQSMFAIANGKSPYATTRGAGAFNDAVGSLVAYHLGQLNYAYRWATESSIGQGMSAERLKMMTKVALLNFETELAGMYLDILYNTPFHRDWARRYMRYKQNPAEMSADPEFSQILPLLCGNNEFINDGGGAFESYVWPMLARGGRGTPQYIELLMQASLVARDLDAFMSHLAYYIPSTQRIPRYYQEAALLWSKLMKQPCPIPVEQSIEMAHDRFLNTFRATSQREAEDQREAMRDAFGDTYWFYYVFNDDNLLK